MIDSFQTGCSAPEGAGTLPRLLESASFSDDRPESLDTNPADPPRRRPAVLRSLRRIPHGERQRGVPAQSWLDTSARSLLIGRACPLPESPVSGCRLSTPASLACEFVAPGCGSQWISVGRQGSLQARPPGAEQIGQVRGIDDTIAVEIGRAAGTGTPIGQQVRQSRSAGLILIPRITIRVLTAPGAGHWRRKPAARLYTRLHKRSRRGRTNCDQSRPRLNCTCSPRRDSPDRRRRRPRSR